MERYPGVQLATLVDEPPQGEDWVHEIKFDGYRLLGFVSAGRRRCAPATARTGPPVSRRGAAMRKLKVEDAVMDMEAVILDENGKSSFQALQAALGDGGKPEKIVAYVFDLLHLDGADLTRLPLTERKEELKNLLKKSKQETGFVTASISLAKAKQMLAQACEKGLEGIISKRANAPYIAGRQKTWLKVKCALRQEFIIVGFSDARTGGRALGALYLGYTEGWRAALRRQSRHRFHHEKRPRTCRALRSELAVRNPSCRARRRRHGRRRMEPVHWVRPELALRSSLYGMDGGRAISAIPHSRDCGRTRKRAT